MPRVPLILVVLLFLATARGDSEESARQAEQDEILRVAIEATVTGSEALIATCNEAVSPDLLPQHLREGVLREYLKDLSHLYELNQAVHRIPDLPTSSLTFIEREEWETILKSGGWQLYRERYPASPEVVSFSYPYLDVAGQKAILYSTRASGLTGGSSRILVLEKRRDGWRLTKNIELLVS